MEQENQTVKAHLRIVRSLLNTIVSNNKGMSKKGIVEMLKKSQECLLLVDNELHQDTEAFDTNEY